MPFNSIGTIGVEKGTNIAAIKKNNEEVLQISRWSWVQEDWINIPTIERCKSV